MSVQTNGSNPSTASCPYIQHIHCDRANDNHPTHVNGGAISSTGIQHGDHNGGCPSDKPSSHSVATSPTCVQNDGHDADCSNDNSPSHISHDATTSTCIQDGSRDTDGPNDKPSSSPMPRPSCPTCVNHDHYGIRCGCPSNGSHPMHADGALHHHWCGQCIKYCFKDVVCDKPLPSVRLFHCLLILRGMLKITYS